MKFMSMLLIGLIFGEAYSFKLETLRRVMRPDKCVLVEGESVCTTKGSVSNYCDQPSSNSVLCKSDFGCMVHSEYGSFCGNQCACGKGGCFCGNRCFCNRDGICDCASDRKTVIEVVSQVVLEAGKLTHRIIDLFVC